MSNQIKLSARPRLEVGRAASKKTRRGGEVPAVIYGAKVPTQGLVVDRKEIERLLSHAGGESILVDLEIQADGKSTNHLTLIQGVQHHALRNEILHVDFHAVSRDQKITTDVPIEAVGEPEGVKTFGGLLENSLRSLEISCLPQNLPNVIAVDVSALKIGDSLHVRHIVLPEGVTTVIDGDITVFSVSEPRVSDAPAGETEAAATEPEVIKEKKPEAEE